MRPTAAWFWLQLLTHLLLVGLPIVWVLAERVVRPYHRPRGPGALVWGARWPETLARSKPTPRRTPLLPRPSDKPSQLSTFLLSLALLAPACGADPGGPAADSTAAALSAATAPSVTPQVSGVTVRLDAVSAVNDRVAWASGRLGTVLRTVDGGETWQVRPVPGAEALAFRDVQAIDADVAYVLTNNGGTNARIYKTEDGGASWTLQFQGPPVLLFYDCFAFWSERRGVAVPDSEEGQIRALRTTDGRTWSDIAGFPAGQPGEGFFPASGTCVATFGSRRAWAVSAGAATPRVLVTHDGGDTWAWYPTPLGGTPTSGGTTIAFRDARHGVIGGGDVTVPTAQVNFARSKDGGKTWALGPAAPFPGPMYGLAYAMRPALQRREDDQREEDDDQAEHGEARRHTLVATGPLGSAWSPDEGNTWQPFASTITGYVSVGFGSNRRGWMVGTSGRIARLDF